MAITNVTAIHLSSGLSVMLYDTLSACYSLAQGAAAAADTGFSAYNRTRHIVLTAITAPLAGIAASIAAYSFQGDSIRTSNRDSRARILSRASQTSDRETAYQAAPSAGTSSPSCCRLTLSIAAQCAYIALDTAKNFASRYFLLMMVQEIFHFELSSIAFYGSIILDLLLKQFFNLSNETYEVCEEITGRIERSIKIPFYTALFIPLSCSPNMTHLFSLVGSIEHVLVDDIAPWLTFLPDTTLDWIPSHPAIAYSLIATMSLLALSLTLLMTMQTYLFEGKHTCEHLKTLNTNIPLPDMAWMSPERKTQLAAAVNIMGPVHGIASAAPVFVTLSKIIDPPSIKWSLAGVAALLTFLATALGVHHSEVKEAKEAINPSPGMV